MSDAQQHVKLSTRARVPTIIPRRNLHRKTRLRLRDNNDFVAAPFEHSLSSRVGSRPEAPPPRRPHRESRRSDHAASQRGHRSTRCPPPAGTAVCADSGGPSVQCLSPGIGRRAKPWPCLSALRAGRAAARVPAVAPRTASTCLSSHLASLSSQEWRPLERSSEWSLLSRPDLPGCLGRDKRGRYGYLLGSLGCELFQPLSLPIVVTAVHTFVGGPVSNFWLHGRDDGPAGSPVNDGPARRQYARRQYAEIVEFEVSGRNVDRALAPRGHFPGNEPVRGVLERRGEAWHDEDPLHPRTLHVSAYSSSLLRPAVGLLDVEEESPVWWQLFGPQEPAGLRDMSSMRDMVGLRRAARSATRGVTHGAAHARVMDRDGALRGAARPRRVAFELLFEDEDLRVARRADGGVTVAERRGGVEPA